MYYKPHDEYNPHDDEYERPVPMTDEMYDPPDPADEMHPWCEECRRPGHHTSACPSLVGLGEGGEI